MSFKLHFLIVIALCILNSLLVSNAVPVLNLVSEQEDSMILQKRGTFGKLTSSIPGINSSRGQKVVGKASEFIHKTTTTPSVLLGKASRAGMTIKEKPLYQAARKDIGNAASYIKKKGSSFMGRASTKVSATKKI